MCNPAIVGLALMAASTAVQAKAQYEQGKAAQAAANFNAQVASNEAETQRNLAQMEIQKGSEERNRLIRAGLAKQGELAGGMGASGFTLDSGSNLSLLGQSAEEIQHDASITTQNANMAAWNRLAGANKADNEAAFSLFQGKTARDQSKLAMTGTILGGIGQGLTGYYQIKSYTTPKEDGKPQEGKK